MCKRQETGDNPDDAVSESAKAVMSAEQESISKSVFSEYDRLEAERRDQYLRDKAAKDHQAKIERETAEWVALVIKCAIIGGLTIIAVCFVAAIIALILSWFLPDLLPPEAIGKLTNFVTFGFGMIATRVVDKLFPAKS